MPSNRTGAGKPYLFILRILIVLVLSGCSLGMPSDSLKSTSLEAETAPLFLDAMKAAADQAPNESIGKAPAWVQKEKADVISAKRLKPGVDVEGIGRGGQGTYANSATGYFMRDFNRLWDTYWVAVWEAKGNFTLADAQNLKVLIVEYEELRRYLRLYTYEDSAESVGFQDEIGFLGDLAIQHRIQIVQHVLALLESESSITSSAEVKKSIGQINEGIAWSNKEVEKMNKYYAGLPNSRSTPNTGQEMDWIDDLFHKYAYKADR